MWVIFRDPNNMFNNLDKYTIELVEDDDILTYQANMCHQIGGHMFDLHPGVFFIQKFLTSNDDVEYFARKYNPWKDVGS